MNRRELPQCRGACELTQRIHREAALPEVRGQLGQAEQFPGAASSRDELRRGARPRVPDANPFGRRFSREPVGPMHDLHEQASSYTVRPARPAGGYLLTPTHAPNAPTSTITTAQLRGLGDRQDTIVSQGSNQIFCGPS